jgi:hypothetical protein
MTLYSDAYNEKLLDDIHGFIREEMNDGKYNDAHPDIVEIFYWNRKTTPVENTVVDSPSKSTLPVIAWIFIGIGITGCLVFFGVWWRQRQKKSEGWYNIGRDNGGNSFSSMSAHSHSESHSATTPADTMHLCGSYLYVPRQSPNEIV